MAKPRIDAFISLENSLALLLKRDLDATLGPVVQLIAQSAFDQDFERARALIDGIDLAPMVERHRRAAEFIGLEAVLLGASRFARTVAETTFAKHKTHPKEVRSAVNLYLDTVSGRVADVVRRRAHDRVDDAERRSVDAGVSKGDGPLLLLKAADPDLAAKLNAVTLGTGKGLIDIGANLTTSRLISFGFLSEAKAHGATEYRVSAILDDRTCPVCKKMDGKTFEVEQAFVRTTSVLSISNPEDLKTEVPFPKQDKASLEALDKMTPEDMAARGWNVPPYHPRCRCTLLELTAPETTPPSPPVIPPELLHPVTTGPEVVPLPPDAGLPPVVEPVVPSARVADEALLPGEYPTAKPKKPKKPKVPDEVAAIIGEKVPEPPPYLPEPSAYVPPLSPQISPPVAKPPVPAMSAPPPPTAAPSAPETAAHAGAKDPVQAALDAMGIPAPIPAVVPPQAMDDYDRALLSKYLSASSAQVGNSTLNQNLVLEAKGVKTLSAVQQDVVVMLDQAIAKAPALEKGAVFYKGLKVSGGGPPGWFEGETISEPWFHIVSPDMGTALSQSNVGTSKYVVRFNVPAGANVLNVPSVMGKEYAYANLNENILPRGAKFKINSITGTGMSNDPLVYDVGLILDSGAGVTPGTMKYEPLTDFGKNLAQSDLVNAVKLAASNSKDGAGFGSLNNRLVNEVAGVGDKLTDFQRQAVVSIDKLLVESEPLGKKLTVFVVMPDGIPGGGWTAGGTVSDPGFTLASKYMEFPSGVAEKVILRLDVPVGSKVIDVDAVLGNTHWQTKTDAFVIPREAQMKITKIVTDKTGVGDVTIIDAELVPAEPGVLGDTMPKAKPPPAVVEVVVPQPPEPKPKKPKPKSDLTEADFWDIQVMYPVPADPEHYYHATNFDRALDIADSGSLKTHKAGEFTDQSAWPDGSLQKRAYFTANADGARYFAPEDGKSVLLRVAKTSGYKFYTESGTGDIYTLKSVRVGDLEYLAKDGTWRPLAPKAAKVPVPKPAAAPPPPPEARPLVPVTPEEVAAIRSARSNGYTRVTDKLDVEDHRVLFHVEELPGGGRQTVATMKLTDDGEKKFMGRAKTAGEVLADQPHNNLDLKLFEHQLVEHHMKATSFNSTGTAPTPVGLKGMQATQHVLEQALSGVVDKLANAYRNDWIDAPTMFKVEDNYKKALSYTKAVMDKATEAKLSPMFAGPPPKFELFERIDYRTPEVKAAEGDTGMVLKNQHMFFKKEIKNGNIVAPAGGEGDHLYTLRGEFHSFSEPGVSLLYADTKKGAPALNRTLSITVAGDGEDAVNRALSVMDRFGIDTSRSTQADDEMLYLVQHINHVGDKAAINGAQKVMGSNWSDTAKLDSLRSLADSVAGGGGGRVTGSAAYRPSGVPQTFGQGKLDYLRPDMEGPEWNRFFDEYKVVHRAYSSKVSTTVDYVLNSGGSFISTTEKLRRGIELRGQSPERDLETGGADYVFTRIEKNDVAGYHPSAFVWGSEQLKRMDSISYNADRYGKTSSEGYIQTHRAKTLNDFRTYATNGSNETIFKKSLPLFDVAEIKVEDEVERQATITVFKKHKITKFPDGRRVEDVVTTWKTTKLKRAA